MWKRYAQILKNTEDKQKQQKQNNYIYNIHIYVDMSYKNTMKLTRHTKQIYIYIKKDKYIYVCGNTILNM